MNSSHSHESIAQVIPAVGPIGTYRKRTIFLLFVLLLIRFWLSQTFELTGQEAYYWMMSRPDGLDWGYLDVGAVVPWLIRLGTWMFQNTEMGVRWIATNAFIGVGFILFYVVRAWFGSRAGFWTTVAFCVMPLHAWHMLLMTPATLSTAWMALALLTYREAVQGGRVGWWIAAGLVSAVAVLTSWINFLWPLGLAAYLFFEPSQQHWLKRVSFWIFAAISLAAWIPIALWMQRPDVQDVRLLHDVALAQVHHPFSLFQGVHFLWDQIWLCSPLFFILLAFAVLHVLRSRAKAEAHRMLLWLAVPAWVLQWAASLFGLHQPAALAPLYLPLLVLAVHVAVEFFDRHRRTAWLGLVLLALTLTQTIAGLMPGVFVHPAFNPGLYQSWSWRAVAEEGHRLKREKGATFFLATAPETAGALSFYLPQQPPVYLVHDKQRELSQFDFWPDYRDFSNDEAILILPTPEPVPAAMHEFGAVEPIVDVFLPDPTREQWAFYFGQNYGGAADPAPEGAAADDSDAGATEKLPHSKHGKRKHAD